MFLCSLPLTVVEALGKISSGYYQPSTIHLPPEAGDSGPESVAAWSHRSAVPRAAARPRSGPESAQDNFRGQAGNSFRGRRQRRSRSRWGSSPCPAGGGVGGAQAGKAGRHARPRPRLQPALRPPPSPRNAREGGGSSSAPESRPPAASERAGSRFLREREESCRPPGLARPQKRGRST